MRRTIAVPALAFALLLLIAAGAQASTVKILNTPSKIIPKAAINAEDLDAGRLVTRAVLPDNYSSRKCWPVIYLLHGTGNGDMDPASTEWIADGHVADANVPAILIVPGGGEIWYTDQWSGGGRSPQWESWLLREVIPDVTKQLHICSGRSNHAIAGLSMGGYGALYFASQRPDYFGSAASFSGVVSLHRPGWADLFTRFDQLYGPAGQFYAVGHDPVALAENLRSTRLLVETGDGTPIDNERFGFSQQFEELEFGLQSEDFARAARAAGASVRFERHAGAHTWLNWRYDFQRMLSWNPFRKVTARPASWSMLTSARQGDAWGTGWYFNNWPTALTRFSMAHGKLTIAGKGTVSLTPAGTRKALTVMLPAVLAHGRARHVKGIKVPVAPAAVKTPIKVAVTPAKPSGTTPVQVSFTTQEKLPVGKQYTALTYPLSGCTQTVTTQASQPAKGARVTLTLAPGTAAAPNATWCKGTAVVIILVTDKSSGVGGLDVSKLLTEVRAATSVSFG